MKSTRKDTFPKIIYVEIEKEKDGEYLVASKFFTEMSEDASVGIYELKDVKTLKITNTLV